MRDEARDMRVVRVTATMMIMMSDVHRTYYAPDIVVSIFNVKIPLTFTTVL
jgi:hypothetical protein